MFQQQDQNQTMLKGVRLNQDQEHSLVVLHQEVTCWHCFPSFHVMTLKDHGLKHTEAEAGNSKVVCSYSEPPGVSHFSTLASALAV